MRRLRSLVRALAVVLALGGCGGGGGAEASPPGSAEDTAAPTPARTGLAFAVKDAAGGTLSVKLAADGSGSVSGRLGGAVDLSAGPLGGGKWSWSPAPGLGILLMDRVPAPLRAVLMAELVDRARP